jgi:hypothetical protein
MTGLTRSIRRTASAALLSAAMVSVAPAPAAASSVGGNAYGLSVAAPLTTVTETPLAVLPVDGGNVSDQLFGFGVPGLLSAGTITSTVQGTVAQGASSASGVVEILDLDILGGLVAADRIVNVGNASGDGTTAGADVVGQLVENLTVNGMNLGNVVPAAGTTITVPGVAEITFNERETSGDGVSTAGITATISTCACCRCSACRSGRSASGTCTSSSAWTTIRPRPTPITTA